jgi:polyhydroxyalkanoate synthase
MATPKRKTRPARPAAPMPTPERGGAEPVAPVDRISRAAIARFTAGLSPYALAAAYFDWAVHMAGSPGKRAFLVEKAGRKMVRYWHHLARCLTGGHPGEACIEPLAQDRRFSGEAWHRQPYFALYQAFLLTQQWWHNATSDVHGVSRHHEDVVNFVTRQLLDMVSPSNFVATNPEVMEATLRQGGQNLVRGLANLADDWERAVLGKPPVGAEEFVPGKTVALTPGKVVFRNRLIELIQYAPTTARVHREPVLIVPAWIMKYYILDLSPQNSLVKHLVDHGHTVFMVSWKNPDAGDSELGLGDYRRLGIEAALATIGRIQPGRRIHGVGYCLGGTLLAIAAAAMAGRGDERFRSLTLLAAQTDFAEAGELMLFIDDAQVSFLEDVMWNQGYLDTKQMAGAFQLLRSNDLIWSRLVREYLMGERAPLNDLMAWNADATRMPYRMHSEYLRRLFLHNDLSEGRIRVDDRPVSLTDIRAPIFAVGTERDHVAPWRSVYKINQLTDADVTFLLATGGHNAGIVSPPAGVERVSGRGYRIAGRGAHDRFVAPETYLAEASFHAGSWWPAWRAWLESHSTGKAAPPPLARNRTLDDAPGSYVLQP